MQVHQSLVRDLFNIWKLQFPVAIGKDVTLFSILRTIFALKRESGKPGVEVKYISTVLSFDIRSPLRFYWSESKTGFGLAMEDPESTQHNSAANNLYEYAITFGLDGQFLVFRDNVSTIAVFEVFREGQKCQTHLHRYITGTFGRFLIGLGKCILHPFLPLVAFTAPFSILLWSFYTGKSSYLSHNVYILTGFLVIKTKSPRSLIQEPIKQSISEIFKL